ncbi:MAG TPA: metallophosphoesterase family protein [Chloroflexota bacterium]|nr:metallophosphoesterase family protein [Chloroflexota bacterium]
MALYAIFSDIHANLPALQVVLADIERRQTERPFDGVYCLGDLGGYGGQPNEVQECVMQGGYPTISGNYDQNVGFNGPDCGCHYIKPLDIAMSDISFGWTKEHTTDQNKVWLRELPAEIRFSAGGRRVLLCHGSPRSNTEYLFENRSDGYLRQFTAGGRADAHADVIVFGHTHVPYHREVDGAHFVNSGSVGRPKDGDPRAGYCLLEITPEAVTSRQLRLPYDLEQACAQLAAAGLPDYFAEYLRTGGEVPDGWIAAHVDLDRTAGVAAES